jgi:hypothetical protein
MPSGGDERAHRLDCGKPAKVNLNHCPYCGNELELEMNIFSSNF